MPLWLQAGFWGAVSGAALVLGAAAGYYLTVPPRATATIMAFGAGVLISALAFDLVAEAYEEGHALVGVVTVAGSLAAFTLDKLGGG